MFLDEVDYDVWNHVQNDSFVPTHFINNEVLNKTRNLWTSKEKEKVKKSFKAKHLMKNALSTG